LKGLKEILCGMRFTGVNSFYVVPISLSAEWWRSDLLLSILS